jgi:hypothetical protein
MKSDNVILTCAMVFCIALFAMTFHELAEFNKLDLPKIIMGMHGGAK